MAATNIPWCDKSWNPIVGCSKISSGCAHCYAERMARRQIAMGNRAYIDTVDDAGRWTGQLNFVAEALDAPLRWKKPCRIFVCSMSDIFNKNSRFAWINQVVGIIDKCEKKNIEHVFIILTKRPGIAWKFFNGLPNPGRLWKNIWLGVTVESLAYIDRIVELTVTPRPPVEKIFVSCEPMLGPVDLRGVLKKVDWVICGSESGPGARPMNPDWARSLRNQCMGADVPFFLKQMTGVKTSRRELPELDGCIWGEFPC